jgi:hypothetical protein
MCDRFLEQQINIRFCVKLGKNASDTCAVLSEANGGKLRKSQVFLSGINSSKRACMSKSHVKTVFLTFFDIKGIIHFEFNPQGHVVNQAYVEVLK